MKIKFYIFIFLIFDFISCKTKEIYGLAMNAKDGASIQTSYAAYIFENVNSWNDSINDKNVKAFVKIIRKENVTKPDSYGEKSYRYKQQRFGKTITVRLKSIKVID